jgi:hypothetical protein
MTIQPTKRVRSATSVLLEGTTYLALLFLVAAVAQRIADGIVVQAFARHAL